MMTRLKRLFIGMVGLMLGIGSCNLGAPSAPPSDTGAILTLTSLVLTLTAPPASATPVVVDVSATLPIAGFPTATELPPTIMTTAAPVVFTPTFTLIPSPSVPMVSVTKGTNCRTGPGVVYDIIGGAPEGVKFLLVGKNTQTNYWIILLQDGRECWLWGQYAVVEGNIAALPEYAVPATPLPPVGSITGTIKDFGGVLIPGATVTAMLSDRSVTSRGDGSYSFDNLAVGIEYITVDASSFAPAHRSVNVIQGDPSMIDFQLRGTSLPSSRPPVIEGRVLINSSPAAGVTVWVWARSVAVMTDANGRYSIQIRPSIGYDDILVLAELGNMRGGAEVFPSAQNPLIAPDITLLPR